MNHSIILFDGVCNYCNALVNFIIKYDKHDRFRFAAQQSDTGKKVLEEYHSKTTLNDTFYLIENGKVYAHATAAFRVLRHLPWYWWWLFLLMILPPSLRDYGYHLVARNRYKIFGKRDECMIPDDSIKEKFLI